MMISSGLSLVTRLIFSIGLTIFLLFGGVATWFGAQHATGHDAMLSWPRVNCRIIASSIGEPKNYKNPSASKFREFPYPFNVTYEYEVGGKKYQGHQPSYGYLASEDYYVSYQLLKRYPAGAATTCRVDPTDPTNSILADSAGPAIAWWLVLIIPLIFAAIGGGGLLLVWLPRLWIEHSFLVRHFGFFIVAFLSFFMVAGICGFIFVVLPEQHRGQAAQSWPQVACVIDHSALQAHENHSRHGSFITYSVAVLFEYSYEGQKYKSSRYAIGNVSTDDKANQAILDRLPRGKETVCYVNPQDPAEAVLDRSYASGLWLWGGVFAMFIFVSGAMLIKILRYQLRASKSTSTSQSS